MRKIIWTFLAVVLTTTFSLSAFANECVKGVPTGTQTRNLLTAQGVVAGTVNAQVVGTDLVVTYAMAGWYLKAVHLWVGEDLSSMPQTRTGNPKVGKFPYKNEFSDQAKSYTFTIPLEDLIYTCSEDGTDYQIAAQADAYKVDQYGNAIETEGVWAAGERIIEQGNWATRFTLHIGCVCADVSTLKDCQAAWAADTQTCFYDLTLNGFVAETGGWSIGPLSSGVYTYPIYAGTQKCDLSTGINVGTLTIYYDEYNLTGLATLSLKDDVVAGSAMFYAGADPLPIYKLPNGSLTLSDNPWLFPYRITKAKYSSTLRFDFSKSAHGSIYVSAFALVCPKALVPPEMLK